jgi:prepilin peptidase dependent protein B
MRLNQRCTGARQRGLSVVELLIGVAVGLFLLGGATKLFVDHLLSNRQMLVETRVNQDLRAAADLVIRDLRRAGYWTDASSGMVPLGAVTAPPNPFRDITVSNTNLLTGEILFSYDRTASSAESAGFRVRNGALQMQLGAAGWQALTDAGSIVITNATLAAPVTRTVDLFRSCPCMSTLDCVAADFAASGVQFATRPRVTVRQYTLTMAGHASNATNIRREIRETVRVRNDSACGVCPDLGSTVPASAPVCS